jgi:protein arginine kinase
MIDPRSVDTIPRWIAAQGPDADVVLATRIRLARCLANHLFPVSASLLQRTEAFEEILAAVRGLARRREYATVNFVSCEKLYRELLVENRFASPELLDAEGDRGVIISDDTSVSIMVNEEDHLRLQCLDAGYRPKETWESLSELDDELGGRLSFAYDSSRGFLTSCPTNSGTGLRASFLMHLPGLILTKTIDQVLQGASQVGITIRGFFGENSEAAGSLFQLSNQATLGASENEFLSGTQETIGHIISCERDARTRLVRDAGAELTDKVYRAWGILMYARSLSMPELLNLFSAVRTGVECGIFDKVTIESLNRTMLLSMPAHLQLSLGRELDRNACDLARADFIREILAGQKQ